MQHKTPLLIDDDLSTHHFLELMYDKTFDPIYHPTKQKKRLANLRRPRLEHISPKRSTTLASYFKKLPLI